jgi:hypothetical protein
VDLFCVILEELLLGGLGRQPKQKDLESKERKISKSKAK